ncbi:MAG: hypothetical protein IPK19_35960 [Chloroflexi bacterium]|nr:hypothetical protein [Chloroflexota bacterium]
MRREVPGTSRGGAGLAAWVNLAIRREITPGWIGRVQVEEEHLCQASQRALDRRQAIAPSAGIGAAAEIVASHCAWTWPSTRTSRAINRASGIGSFPEWLAQISAVEGRLSQPCAGHRPSPKSPVSGA